MYCGGTTMKNNSATIETISLNSLVQHSRQKILKQILSVFQEFFSSRKEQVELCVATVAVGAIFLGSILIFFIQLAEYGW